MRVGPKVSGLTYKSRTKQKMLRGIYSAFCGEVNVSVSVCVEIKGEYIDKQQSCFISVTLKSWSGRKLLNPPSYYLPLVLAFFVHTNVSYNIVITFASDRWFGLVDIWVQKEVKRGSVECHHLHHLCVIFCVFSIVSSHWPKQEERCLQRKSRCVLVLFMSVIQWLLLQLFELANLLVVQLGRLYLAARTYQFVDLLLVLCMDRIRVLGSLNIHNFSIIGVQLLLVSLLD